MNNRYEFDRIFRQRIIALCFQADWFARFGNSIVKPEFFDLEQEVDLVTFLLDFYQAYSRPPKEDEVASEFVGYPDVLKLLDEVLDRLDDDSSYTQERALQFAREQAVKLAMLESMDEVERGIIAPSIDRLSEALLVGDDLSDMGLDLMGDSDKWSSMESLVKIGTGDALLDKLLDGGLARTEYGIILGPTNIGKTMMLVNLGHGAMNVMNRANVVHISLEMKDVEIARRYAARTADYFLRKDASVIEYMEDFFHMAKLRLFGQLRVKSLPTGEMTVAGLKGFLQSLITSGFIPDLLLVDYPELMNLERVGDYRHNLSRTNQLLRGMAESSNFNLAIWAVAQSNRTSMSQEVVGLDTVAEDLGIVRVADTVMTMSQTPEEYDAGIIRLGGMKVRSAAKNWILRCRQIQKAHAIIGMEVITMEDLRSERKEREANQSEDTKSKIADYAEKRKQKYGNGKASS